MVQYKEGAELLLTSPLDGGERSTLASATLPPGGCVVSEAGLDGLDQSLCAPAGGFGPQKVQTENKEKVAIDNRQSKE